MEQPSENNKNLTDLLEFVKLHIFEQAIQKALNSEQATKDIATINHIIAEGERREREEPLISFILGPLAVALIKK